MTKRKLLCIDQTQALEQWSNVFFSVQSQMQVSEKWSSVSFFSKCKLLCNVQVRNDRMKTYFICHNLEFPVYVK